MKFALFSHKMDFHKINLEDTPVLSQSLDYSTKTAMICKRVLCLHIYINKILCKIQAPSKNAYIIENYFSYFSIKTYIVSVLKRTISIRRFFCASTSYV